MKRLTISLIIVAGLCFVRATFAGLIFVETENDQVLRPTDPVAPRDDIGLLHQMPHGNETDFAPRHHWRPAYWFLDGQEVIRSVAYVAAMQRDLDRLGYYCGPIDGVYTADVSDSIARLQKAYSMRVTGTPTWAVRRALHLP